MDTMRIPILKQAMAEYEIFPQVALLEKEIHYTARGLGIETAFPLLYTYLVKEDIISMERLMQLLVHNPRKRFGIPHGCDFTIWDLRQSYYIESEQFLSMGKSTPFQGWKVWGKPLATVCDGKLVWMDKLRK